MPGLVRLQLPDGLGLAPVGIDGGVELGPITGDGGQVFCHAGTALVEPLQQLLLLDLLTAQGQLVLADQLPQLFHPSRQLTGPGRDLQLPLPFPGGGQSLALVLQIGVGLTGAVQQLLPGPGHQLAEMLVRRIRGTERLPHQTVQHLRVLAAVGFLGREQRDVSHGVLIIAVPVLSGQPGGVGRFVVPVGP